MSAKSGDQESTEQALNNDNLPTMQHEGSKLDAYVEHLEKAQQAGEAGDNARAIVEYEAAIMMRPNMFHPHLMLGQMMFKNGNNAEALRHLTTAHNLQPDNLDVLNHLAELMVRFGNIEGAKGIACEAVEINDGHPPSICLLANILAAEDQYDDAVHLLQCAIEEQPEEWTFWHTIAMIQADRKDPENAVIFFDEALRLNPTAKLLKSDYEDFKKKFPDAVASA